jgi:hypothetical protein
VSGIESPLLLLMLLHVDPHKLVRLLEYWLLVLLLEWLVKATASAKDAVTIIIGKHSAEIEAAGYVSVTTELQRLPAGSSVEAGTHVGLTLLGCTSEINLLTTGRRVAKCKSQIGLVLLAVDSKRSTVGTAVALNEEEFQPLLAAIADSVASFGFVACETASAGELVRAMVCVDAWCVCAVAGAWHG